MLKVATSINTGVNCPTVQLLFFVVVKTGHLKPEFW